MRHWFLITAAAWALSLTLETAAADSPPPLLPAPRSLMIREGAFTLRRTTVLMAGAETKIEADKLAAALRKPTDFELPVKSGKPRENSISLLLEPSLKNRLGHEGYRLLVTPSGVRIEAASTAGLFYASVTLRQLLPADIYSPGQIKRKLWSIPAVEIEDSPRFAWRGLLIDPARHFVPVGFLKKFVTVMAEHKLNTLQIHLTDDQGWRMEIKKYPLLTRIGSVRKESPAHGDRNRGDDTVYGPCFYTQAELRDLVAFAQRHHVTIVPEFEVPGHLGAALAAYPEYSCTGGPFEVRTRWGIEEEILCAGNDQAVTFATDVLEEMTQVFPGPFVHIGGDEAPRTRWKQCAKCQARMRASGLTTEAQLQTWLNQQLERFLVKQGRRMIGWDEILEGGLTTGAAVMSWRGMQGGLAAAEAGHDVVMSPTTHCYFDYAQGQGHAEPESIGGFIPLKKVYGFDPIPPGLPLDKHHHILGVQGNLWSEFLWTPEDVEQFAFPRAVALAEVGWSRPSSKSFSDFERRLRAHLLRLDVLAVTYYGKRHQLN